MTEPEKLVENLLGDESIDPKEFANDLKAETEEMRRLGVVNAQTVRQGDTIYHHRVRNADGTAARAKVTSVQTWKRRPDYFEIGWKHGMYSYGRINPSSAVEWTLNEPPPIPRTKRKRK